MGKHPADIKTLRTAASPHEMRPVSQRVGLPHSVQKKQAAHISRVPQPVATRCPEFVVWTTPAGPDAGRHRSTSPASVSPAAGMTGGARRAWDRARGDIGGHPTHRWRPPAVLPPVPATGSRPTVPRPARARHVTFIRHTITILRVPVHSYLGNGAIGPVPRSRRGISRRL